MTGLLDIFWRHFTVLTNFQVNVMESRPFESPGLHQGGPLPGGLTGPAGWVQGRVTAG